MGKVKSKSGRGSLLKAVFLDLDNTLYAYEPCHRHALKKSFAYYRRRVEAVSFRRFLKQYNRARGAVHRRLRAQAASHSRLLYFQTLLERRLGKTDTVHSLRLEAVYWKSFLARMRRARWVLPFLKSCKKAGVRIVLVTNLTAQIQMEKIGRLGIGRWVDFLVSSEEAGIEKPAPEIFRLALKKARCRPDEVWVIGDHPRDDAPPFLAFRNISHSAGFDFS